MAGLMAEFIYVERARVAGKNRLESSGDPLSRQVAGRRRPIIMHAKMSQEKSIFFVMFG
jgi:hypothetical protein